MHMSIKKDGFLTVEASIFLPIFLLAMLSLVSVIRMAGVEATAMKLYAVEATQIAKEAYVTQIEEISTVDQSAPFKEMVYGALIRSRLKETINQSKEPIGNPGLEHFQYLYSENGMDGLISGTLSYHIELPLPIFHRELEYGEKLLYRGFIGSTTSQTALGFLRMEQEEESKIIYVFPRAGEKYHEIGCRILESYAEEHLLTNAIKQQYHPCPICKAGTLSIGSKVYYFPDTGEAYHRSRCPLVDRFTIPMERSEAIEKGYEPCVICGGGE